MKKITLLLLLALVTHFTYLFGDTMRKYDFTSFTNVEISGVNLETLSSEELSVLYAQARYCQAMVDADVKIMRELVARDKTFTHMSGMKQTREEYFNDIQRGSLNYFNVGIENPKIEINGNKAKITYTSILDANAYGAKGKYRMSGTHKFEKRDGVWILVD